MKTFMMHRQAALPPRLGHAPMPRRVAAMAVSTGEHAKAKSSTKQNITQLDSLKQVRASQHYESLSS